MTQNRVELIKEQIGSAHLDDVYLQEIINYCIYLKKNEVRR